MNTITKLFAFVLAITTAAAAHAQVTGTSLPNKTTLTSGNVTTTSPFVYTDGVGLGVRKVTIPDLMDFGGWGPLDTGVLAGLTLNGSLTSTAGVISRTALIQGLLTTTGGIVTNSASISGLITTSGITSVTGTISGTLTVSGLSNLTTIASTTATITNLVGTTLTIGGNMTLTGQVQIRGYHENFGRVDMRNAQSTKLSIGTAGQQYVTFADTTPSSYLSIFGGYGIGFSKDTGGVLVGIASVTDGYLKITNGTTTSGFGTIQTGGFASNFRALAASGNLTTTDAVVTLTGAITLSLPSTSITGQQFILKNIGGVTGTATVVGGTKTIDGATTQAIVSGAGKTSAMQFTYDGTNYIISQ